MKTLLRSKVARGFVAALIVAVASAGAAFALLSDGDSPNDPSTGVEGQTSESQNLLRDVPGRDSPPSDTASLPPALDVLGNDVIEGPDGAELSRASWSPATGVPEYHGHVNCDGPLLYGSVTMFTMPRIQPANVFTIGGADSQVAYFNLHLITYSQSAGWVHSGITTGWNRQDAIGRGGLLGPNSSNYSVPINFPSHGYYKVAIEYLWWDDANHGRAYQYDWAGPDYGELRDPSYSPHAVEYCTY